MRADSQNVLLSAAVRGANGMREGAPVWN